MLSTVSRTGRVLALFSEDTPEWGVREAAVKLGWPKSNTHAMLASLAGIGLLQRTSSSKYRLGWRLLSLGRTVARSSRLEDNASVVAHDLSRSLRLPVTVGTWDGLRVVSLASFTGESQDAPFAPGSRLPGHSSALGKVLMSSLNKSEIDACVERFGLPRLTHRTNTRASVFREQLEEAQVRGLAFDEGESIAGRHCIAAPVRNADAEIIAAISISSGPETMRDHQSRLAAAVRGSAQRLSTLIAMPQSLRTLAGPIPSKPFTPQINSNLNCQNSTSGEFLAPSLVESPHQASRFPAVYNVGE